MDIAVYYVPTHYSAVLLRSLHYYRSGLIILTIESKMLWQLTFFVLLQQCFSTISLKAAKSRPTILLENRTKIFYRKSIEKFCFFCINEVCHTKYLRCCWKNTKSRTKNAWELHAALRTVFESHCSTSTITHASYDVTVLAMIEGWHMNCCSLVS